MDNAIKGYSVFEQYGIPDEKAKIRGMVLLEYLRAQSPNLCEIISEIPKDLDHLIDKFEIAWSLPLTKKYTESRGITRLIALREFIQNALDIEHITKGYDAINVKIYVDKLGTHIVDSGTGLTWDAFIIGKGDKPHWLRGKFGEGLDLATLKFATNGYPVYIFSKNIVYKVVYHEDIFMILIGRSKKFVNGTDVLIYKYNAYKDDININIIYYKLNNKLKLLNTVQYGNPPMPNMIFEDDSDNKSLYVRDIFVNFDKYLFSHEKLFYTYNLWWIDLDPNRTNVVSRSQLSDEIGRTLLLSPKQFSDMIASNIEKREYLDISYYVLNLDDYVEGAIYFDSIVNTFDYKNTEQYKLLIEYLSNIFKRYGISCAAKKDDISIIPLVQHEGGNVLLVPYEYYDLIVGFLKILPPAKDFITESLSKSMKNISLVNDEMLPFDTLKKLRKYYVIIDYINDSKGYDIKIQPIRGRSHTSNDTIYISVADKPETFIHELAHAIGYCMGKDARDYSKSFGELLEHVGEYMIRIAEDPTFSIALRRINNGVMFPNPYADEIDIENIRDIFKKIRNVHIHYYKHENLTDTNIGLVALIPEPAERERVHIFAIPVSLYNIVDLELYRENSPFIKDVIYLIDSIINITKNILNKIIEGMEYSAVLEFAKTEARKFWSAFLKNEERYEIRVNRGVNIIISIAYFILDDILEQYKWIDAPAKLVFYKYHYYNDKYIKDSEINLPQYGEIRAKFR